MTQQTAPTDPSDEPKKPSAPMRVSRIKVRNFRLLRNVDIDLDGRTTVLVGRNNSGKTTLAEAFSRFLQPSTLNFTVADFSAESYPEFLEAWKAYVAGDEEAARNLLPEISLTVEISYSKELPEYGPLAAAIVDLDPDCTTAMIRFSYSLEGGRLSDFLRGLQKTRTRARNRTSSAYWASSETEFKDCSHDQSLQLTQEMPQIRATLRWKRCGASSPFTS